ncbi:restriction endonuclease subunit S [Macellibacteroides fermentans]|uniref:restriction endonuclease subunit S n=1 Tax=Macellibacteroides fermentans TaxID=879969 RepID=UPI003B93DA53
MEKKKNTPKLRFPEFTGEWEEKKLGEIAEKVNSGKTPLGGESVYVDKGILFIRSQNVFDNKLSLENATFITEETNSTMENSIVKSKDILLNITGASLGRSCVVPENFIVGNVNQHVCIIRLNKDNEPYFFQPIFASEKGQNLFKSLQVGGGREGLNFQSIRGITLYQPPLSEQTKIATFLTAVDEKLTQLKKKKTLLEQYKKGVMQKLFSQELRFKDDNNQDFPDWEEKKLGEMGTFFSGGTPLTTKKIYYEGNIPFIRSGEINSDKTELHISELGLVNSSAKIIEIGDLIYALYGATSGEVAISKIRGAINQAILCIRTSMINQFLCNYLILKKDIILSTYLQGGQGNLSADIIKSLIIPHPSLPEQVKIANFLSAIDEKISHCSAQIEKMEAWKKGLLQQMFC